ncbi:hypothetical protein JSE7799_02189 [Jannaschia seosinensis]|uniref:Uncharacterized protein n=1 Tax=Jannaschia seosinensis TaxID=313367 RepID=A0A0M7BCB7_9RHOB|nr:hypothetical protein [Jannaschia seosinensis]CUH39462.1 hypothetical protein JSE7799_02189 [Jannaschia seosinensis]
MAVWFPELNLLYVLNPRTASSATAMTLKRNFQWANIPNQDIVDENGHHVVDAKHSSFSEIEKHALMEPEIFENALNPDNS